MSNINIKDLKTIYLKQYPLIEYNEIEALQWALNQGLSIQANSSIHYIESDDTLIDLTMVEGYFEYQPSFTCDTTRIIDEHLKLFINQGPGQGGSYIIGGTFQIKDQTYFIWVTSFKYFDNFADWAIQMSDLTHGYQYKTHNMLTLNSLVIHMTGIPLNYEWCKNGYPKKYDEARDLQLTLNQMDK